MELTLNTLADELNTLDQGLQEDIKVVEDYFNSPEFVTEAFVQKRDKAVNDFIEKRNSLGYQVEDVAKSTVRGVAEAGKNATVSLARTVFDDTRTEEEIAPFFSGVVKSIGKADTTAGELAESFSTFLTGFIATRGLGTTYKMSMVRGAITDSLVWDEDDSRISDVLADNNIQNALINYLKHNPDDSKAEDMFKNALEGALTGLVADGVIKSIVSGYRASKSVLWKDKTADEVVNILDGKAGVEAIQPEKQIQPEPTPNIENIDSKQKQLVIDFEALANDKKDIFNYDKTQVPKEYQYYLNNLGNTEEFIAFTKSGHKPQELTIKEAKELEAVVGKNPTEFVRQIVKDTEDLDSKLVALKRVMLNKIRDISDLAKSSDDKSLFEAVELLNELDVIAKGTKAVQTSSARTTTAGNITLSTKQDLELLKEISNSDDYLFSNSKSDVTKTLGQILPTKEKRKIKNVIDEVLSTTNPKDVSEGLEELSKPDGVFTKIGNVANEVRTAGLLSGPTTLAVNLFGNTLVRGIGRIEDYVAYGIGKTFNTKDRILWNELQALGNETFTSVGDTFVGITKAFKNVDMSKGAKGIEESLENGYLDKFSHKVDTTAVNKLSSDYILEGVEKSDIVSKGASHLIDVVGAGVRLPYHALGVTDDMFKRSAFNGHIHYLATKEANKLGLVGKEFNDYINDFVKAHKLVSFKNTGKQYTEAEAKLIKEFVGDNNGRYFDEALMRARELTFQEPIPNGKTASRINRALSKIDELRTLHPIGEFIVPFYKTPVNILKWVGRRTPGIHLLSKKTMNDIRAGGSRKNLAYARLSVGTSLYALGGFLASEGIVVPGNQTEQERKGFAVGGYQGYSIKIGNDFVDATRFDPVILPILLSADLYSFHQEMVDRGLANLEGYQEHFDEVVGAVITSFSSNVLDKSWLKSVSDLVTAIKYGNEEYANQSIASFMPYSSLSRTLERTENIKEAKGLLENIKKIYSPHLLRDKLDVFGKTIKTNKTYGLRTSTKNTSPIRQEIARLKVPITKFSNKIEYKGVTLELEPEEHYKLQKYMDTVFSLEDNLNKVVNSSAYKNARDGLDSSIKGTKKYFINDAINKAKQKARKFYLSKNKEKVEELRKKHLEKVEDSKTRQTTMFNMWSQ